jgi:uncharacterized protein YkwD
MVPFARVLGRRRLASLSLAALVAAAIVVPGQAAATTVTVPDAGTISAAESAMVTALNADRGAAGLVAVRTDSRLMAIARARSDDMVAEGYFSHTQPDGRNVFDILTGAGVTWYNAGEIIAWNNYPMDSTTSAANRQWMGSPGHKAIILSGDLNYVGVGLAVDPATGKKIWTAVFIKGPDRTGARAAVGAATITAGTSSLNRHAKIAWSGADVRLQVLTAGFRSFTVQKRIDGGAWTTVWSSTTLKAATFTVYLKHRYEYRVSAVDNRGNRGSWVTTVVDLR